MIIENSKRRDICRPFARLIACLSVILFLIVLSFPILAADRPALIVNKSVQQSSMSKGALRTIFGMRLRSWKDGSAIRVIVLPDNHPLHADFSKRVLGMFPHQLRWAWDRLVYSGTGQAPIQVSTEEQMLHLLQSTPGAIGYLRQEPDDDSVHSMEIR